MCMELYLRGQNLWDVMGGSEIMPSPATYVVALCKWKVKVGNAMFMIKTIMEKEMLKHEKKVMISNKAWDKFTTLFFKVNYIQL